MLYFRYHERRWNIGVAAASIFVVISFFAIIIDINNLYGEYGINTKAYTLPTLLLFCLQGTITLLPLHYISNLQIEQVPYQKEKLLRILVWSLIISAGVSYILVCSELIKIIAEGDFARVRIEHYEDIEDPFIEQESRNYIKLLISLLTTPCFTTLDIILAMYIFAFSTSKRFGAYLLLSSTAGIGSSILIAGRSAIIYWIFSIYLIYLLFYPYIDTTIKRRLNLVIQILIVSIGVVFLLITFSRFNSRNPFDSLCGYAGQHINNFCAIMQEGGNSPHQSERIFPLTNKLLHHKNFNLKQHYDTIESHTNVIVHVFDTFGAEVYCDFGSIGYILCLSLIILTYIFIKSHWNSIAFNRIFPLSIIIVFFVNGLFAWPFVGHYATSSVLLMGIIYILFRYNFKFKK